MSEASMYAPDYLRQQEDKQLHSIADMIEKQIKTIEELRNFRVKYYQATGALGYPVPGDIPEGDIKCGLCEAKAKDIVKGEVRTHTLYQVIKILAEAR